MSTQVACDQLARSLQKNTLRLRVDSIAALPRVAEKRLEEGKETKLDASSPAVLVARVGASDQKIVATNLQNGRLI